MREKGKTIVHLWSFDGIPRGFGFWGAVGSIARVATSTERLLCQIARRDAFPSARCNLRGNSRDALTASRSLGGDLMGFNEEKVRCHLESGEVTWNWFLTLKRWIFVFQWHLKLELNFCSNSNCFQDEFFWTHVLWVKITLRQKILLNENLVI